MNVYRYLYNSPKELRGKVSVNGNFRGDMNYSGKGLNISGGINLNCSGLWIAISCDETPQIRVLILGAISLPF